MTSLPVSYRIIYSHRRSIGILVSPDQGVIVRAPYRTPVHDIEKFVTSKSSWIKKHLESYSGMVRLNHAALHNGKIILYRGREYILKIEGSSRNSVRRDEEEIVVSSIDPGKAALTSVILENWYKKMAAEHITGIMNDILSKYSGLGFRPSGISLRSMKRRWGSCSNRGKITINTELIKLDDRYTEYVILHELCHLRHHNHGQAFYNLLSEVCPGWKEIRKESQEVHCITFRFA